MAAQSRYVELARHITALGAVKRALARGLPAECPGGPAAVLALLEAHGEMRMSRLSELLAVDVSVTSRHVAHAVQRGWLERMPDPADGRSRIIRLTPAGSAVLASLGERAVDLITHTLADWSDDDLDLLSSLLVRLRADFGDCRAWSADHAETRPAAGRAEPAESTAAAAPPHSTGAPGGTDAAGAARTGAPTPAPSPT